MNNLSHGGQETTDGNAPLDPAGALNYKFSPDELRALKECNRESFYYRCLPFGTFLGAGTFFAVKAGYLSASARYGAIPKVFAAVTVGYFIGKFSYQQKCVEKLMALPNSQLGEQLRKQRGRGRGMQEVISYQEPGLLMSPGGAIPAPSDDTDISSQFTDVGDTRPMNAFDSDTSVFGGIDDHYGPAENENQMKEDTLPPKPPQFFTSYDNLRKQNRQDFENARAQHVQTNADSAQRERERRNRELQNSGSGQTFAPTQQAPASLVGKKKNIYGDVWDDKAE